eukprot:c22753_g1_i1 orf=210-755(+)
MASSGNGLRPSCLLLLLVGILLVVAASSDVSVTKQPRPFKKHNLQYFVQLQVGTPGLAPGFLPPVNTTFSANFGSGVLFAFNLTTGLSPTSKPLGSVRGYTVETNFVAGSTPLQLEVAVVEYDDGRFAGTIHLQGLVQPAATEVAVTGGTGSFRGARGYITVNLVKDSPSLRTFSHDLHLF